MFYEHDYRRSFDCSAAAQMAVNTLAGQKRKQPDSSPTSSASSQATTSSASASMVALTDTPIETIKANPDGRTPAQRAHDEALKRRVRSCLALALALTCLDSGRVSGCAHSPAPLAVGPQMFSEDHYCACLLRFTPSAVAHLRVWLCVPSLCRRRSLPLRWPAKAIARKWRQ